MRSSHFANYARQCALSQLYTYTRAHVRCVSARARLPSLFNFSTDFYLSREQQRRAAARSSIVRLFFSFRWTVSALASGRHKSLRVRAARGSSGGVCRLADVCSPRERKSPFVPRNVNNYSCKRAVPSSLRLYERDCRENVDTCVRARAYGGCCESKRDAAKRSVVVVSAKRSRKLPARRRRVIGFRDYRA